MKEKAANDDGGEASAAVTSTSISSSPAVERPEQAPVNPPQEGNNSDVDSSSVAVAVTVGRSSPQQLVSEDAEDSSTLKTEQTNQSNEEELLEETASANATTAIDELDTATITPSNSSALGLNEKSKAPPTATQPGAVAVAGPSSSSAAPDIPPELSSTSTSGIVGAQQGEEERAVTGAAAKAEFDDDDAPSQEHETLSPPSKSATIAATPDLNYVQEDEESSFSTSRAALHNTTEDTTMSKSDDRSVVQGAQLPVATQYQELPLISATTVPPEPVQQQPVTAVPVVYQVDFDEGPGWTHNGEEPPQQIEDGREKKGMSARHKRILIPIVGFIAVTIVAVVVGVLVRKSDESESPPEAIPSNPYPCYSSTLDLLTAQVEARMDTMLRPLILCPNTRIKIGTFKNPSRNDFNITGGDYPISIIRQNVTIQCGLDGSRANNCVVEGGLVHIANQYSVYHPIYGYQDPAPHLGEFVLRGMTFTGSIQASGVFGGIAVALSHPGRTVFEDCAWVDFTATKRLIAVGRNYLMELSGIELADLSVELVISNCLFDDVFYEEDFIVSFNQTIHIENSVFRNIQLPPLLPDGCAAHPNGCRQLLNCFSRGPSKCSISDVCVENFDTAGAGPITTSDESDWESTGENTWIGPVELGSDTQVVSDDDLPFCALSVARFAAGTTTYTCLDTPVFEWNESGTCLK